MSKHLIRRIIFYSLHSIGFIFLYFILKDLEFKKLIELILKFPVWKVIFGLVILASVYLIKSLRWYLINQAFRIKSHYFHLLIFFLVSGFFSAITPGRLGEFVKIYFLKNKYKTTLPLATSSVLLDRIWDVLVLSLMGVISMVLVFSNFQIQSWTILLIILIFLLSIVMVLFPGSIFLPVIYITKKKSFTGELRNIYSLWKENKFRFLLPGFLTSITAFLLLAFIPVTFSVELNAPVSFFTGISAVSISNILSFLPITVAGFGTRELVFLKIWGLYGYYPEIAISVSTAHFIVTYLGSILIGSIVYILWFRKLYPVKLLKEDR